MKPRRCYKYVLLCSLLLFLLPICLQICDNFSFYIKGAEKTKLKLSNHESWSPSSTKYSLSAKLSLDEFEDLGDFEVVDDKELEKQSHKKPLASKQKSQHSLQRNSMGGGDPQLPQFFPEFSRSQKTLQQLSKKSMMKKKLSKSSGHVTQKMGIALTSKPFASGTGKLSDIKEASKADQIWRGKKNLAGRSAHWPLAVDLHKKKDKRHGFRSSNEESKADAYLLNKFQQNGLNLAAVSNCSCPPCPNHLLHEDLSRYEQCCHLAHLSPSPQEGIKCQFRGYKSERSHQLTALAASPMGGANRLRMILEEVTGVCTGSLSCDSDLRRRGMAGENIASSAVLLVKVDDIGKDFSLDVSSAGHRGGVFDSLIFLLRNPYHSMLENWEGNSSGAGELLL